MTLISQLQSRIDKRRNMIRNCHNFLRLAKASLKIFGTKEEAKAFINDPNSDVYRTRQAIANYKFYINLLVREQVLDKRIYGELMEGAKFPRFLIHESYNYCG